MCQSAAPIDTPVSRPNENWYALRVKARSERLIASVVRQKGYEEFVPVYKCQRRWSDRMKSIEMPLFPGYVFCRLNPTHRLPLLTIPGVLHFVGIRNTPIVIDDIEMAAMQMATQSGLPTEPWPYIEGGKPVAVEGGPLQRLVGHLVESQDQCRLVVSMSVLRRSVAVEIDRKWVSMQWKGVVSSLSASSEKQYPSSGMEGR